MPQILFFPFCSFVRINALCEIRDGIPVCTENLNPDVVMMKSAQDSVRTYDAGSLNRPRNRRIFVQRSMRSDAVVIIGVRFQNPAQMLLAEDNEVIQTLTPDRSDQPFGKAILPR